MKLDYPKEWISKEIDGAIEKNRDNVVLALQDVFLNLYRPIFSHPRCREGRGSTWPIASRAVNDHIYSKLMDAFSETFPEHSNVGMQVALQWMNRGFSCDDKSPSDEWWVDASPWFDPPALMDVKKGGGGSG